MEGSMKMKRLKLNVMIISAMLVLSMVWMAIMTSASAAEINSTILYVKPAAIGDCTSWSTTCELQTALNTATTGDQIWLAKGRYVPTTTGDRFATFQLKNGVIIYGGFNGTETSLGQRKWVTNVTILSGDLAGNDDGFNNNEENSYHVVTGATGAILDGVTISGGNATGPEPNHVGGGVLNLYSDPMMTNVTITGNYANYGGGMGNYPGSPTLTNVAFSNNTATTNGGGLWNGSTSHPTLNNVTFDNNSAQSGGGIYSEDSNALLTDVTFSRNSAIYGGGMRTDWGNPTLLNVTFDHNDAGQSGGGMFIFNSDPVLNNITFRGNTAQNGGGMINTLGSAPTLTNVTFITNTTTVQGGGMTEYGNSTLTNVTFIQNSTGGNGGGMFNENSAPILVNVTFSGNTAIGGGGGIGNFTSSPQLTNVTFNNNAATNYGGSALFNYNNSNPIVRNSILWGDIGGEIFNTIISTAVVTYSDVQGGYAGIGNINADPLLAALGVYGGQVETLAMLPGSPVINATNSACPTTDARGVMRSSPNCDLGAFESLGFSQVKTSGDNQSTSIDTKFDQPLCVAVTANGADDPVDGGKITFTPPVNGKSATMLNNPATINIGSACTHARANDIPGSYIVIASAVGANSVTFDLTNKPVIKQYLSLVIR
jgi:predicted outer membrane repeat protein